MTRLDDYKKCAKKWLVSSNWEYIDFIFGTILANRYDSIPLWVFLVGPPSSGKTEIAVSTDGHPEVYIRDSLTSHALVSGKEMSAEELAQGKEDPSLAPKLHGKVLIIKDFTQMLSKRSDEVREVLGQLRSAYDGTISASFGSGRDISYTSKFGLIAAVTKAIENHRLLLSDLGERFLYYRMPDPSQEEILLRMAKAHEACNHESNLKEELRAAAHKLLELEIREVKIPEKVMDVLKKLALFISTGRGAVSRERFTRDVMYLPQPEIPTRLIKQLVLLTQSLTVVREQSRVTEDIVRMVVKVGMDSIPSIRSHILGCLDEMEARGGNGPSGKVTKKQLQEALGVKSSAFQRWMEDLELLKMVKSELSPISNGYRYWLNNGTGEIMNLLRSPE